MVKYMSQIGGGGGRGVGDAERVRGQGRAVGGVLMASEKGEEEC